MRIDGSSCCLLHQQLLQSCCFINHFIYQPSPLPLVVKLCRETAAWGFLWEAFLVLSQDTRHLLPPWVKLSAANMPHSCRSWAATDTESTPVHTINRVRQTFLLRECLVMERLLWMSGQEWLCGCTDYLQAGRHTEQPPSPKPHWAADFFLANGGLLGRLEDM